MNDFLQETPDSETKIARLELDKNNSDDRNLDIRFALINQINPLTSNAAELENTILQILREVIDDK